ncbi:Peptidase family M50 [Candidatus Anstonella stagnisolia]|nr:Peptidase family M50 [Candidatus Anstonella stagnisolia]
MGKFSIDTDEAIHMLVSIVAISLSITFAQGGIKMDAGHFIFLMIVFGITVGSGFVLHELAHKYFAVKYGARARFQAWPAGLVLMLSLAIVPQLFGFSLPLILAPGAVYIYAYRGQISSKQNGIISLAGPATNIALCALFLVLFLVLPNEILAPIFFIGAQVNIFLALFNLLPIFPLDGSKVIAWNWQIWLAVFMLCFLGSSIVTF